MPDFGFAFVSTDSFGRPDAAHRKLIRSHCVKGKNRRPGSYRSAKYAREAQEAAAVAKLPGFLQTQQPIPGPSWETVITAEFCSSKASEEKSSGRSPHGATSVELWDAASQAGQGVHPSPPLTPTTLAFVRLADDIGEASLGLVSDCVSYTALRRTIHPIELCLDFGLSTGLDRGFAWMAEDAAYLHSALLGLSALRDYSCGLPPSRITIFHLRKTLALLNRKLTLRKAHLLDSVIFIVMSLHMAADMFGDRVAAQTHMRGLEQVVCLRGGMEKLDPKLRFKIACLDISRSVSTGDLPRFSILREPWQPVFRGIYPAPTCSSSITMLCLDGLVSQRIGEVFRDLQHIVTVINRHSDRSMRVSGDAFQTAMDSIQARLVASALTQPAQTDNEKGSECLRLGMLAFSTTLTFQLPWRRYPYQYLAESLRSACQAVETLSIDDKRGTALSWVLVMGVMSVFDTNADWLRTCWSKVVPACSRSAWEGLRQQLGGVMWIGYIHDKPGEEAFNALSDTP